ncbi:hypothetical protein [Sphingomicrobium aestuariivivum]|nr:hypothetical protein [Sphingomicrobium aestuariivivum]MCJ8191366.1 hypothetical protein [Sphingomicrobium aestuariivivum]
MTETVTPKAPWMAPKLARLEAKSARMPGNGPSAEGCSGKIGKSRLCGS